MAQAKITVRVTPRAKHNEIVGLEDGVWHIRVAAPPVEGRANWELLEFLSQRLGISRSAISLLMGQHSRRKVLAIEGLSADEAARRLSA